MEDTQDYGESRGIDGDSGQPSHTDLPRTTRFRFKSKSKRDERSADGSASPTRPSKRRKAGHSDHHSSRRERTQAHGHHARYRHRHGSDDTWEGKEPVNPTYEMDAETAFRESLFDAMADDEGAAFWEGVYGQPIHTYPNVKPSDGQAEGPEDETLRMTDEEYVAYVREKMWEKSHQHVIEERKRREEAARRRAEAHKRTLHMEDEREAFDRRIEESLRKGEARKTEKVWRDAWNRYTRGWEKLLASSKAGAAEDGLVNGVEITGLIPWPVRSGKAKDVGKKEVETFFDHAASREGSEDGMRSLLKVERVRWHPDKMQQRFGSSKIDAETLKAVVAVFQIVDARFAAL